MTTAVITGTYHANSASAAEDNTAQAAQQVTAQAVANTATIAPASTAPIVEEQRSVAKTSAYTDIGAGNSLTTTQNAPMPISVDAKLTIDETSVSKDADALLRALAGKVSDEEAYDLILTIRHKSRILSQATVGIQKGFTNYIPMIELAKVLKFESEYDLNTGNVKGFFLSEDNTYTLDVQNSSYSVAGENFALPANNVIIRNKGQGIGDIYVTPEFLNKIWPLNLEMNFAEQSIQINTDIKLPYEIELERLEKQKNFKAGGGIDYESLNLPHIPNGYKLISKPVINLSNQSIWDQEKGELRDTFNISGRNDLLGTSASYNLSIGLERDDTPEIRNTRIKLTRRDYGKGGLPLGLKLVQAGDISARPPDLIDSTLDGRGILVSTRPKQRENNFDSIRIDGIATPGWGVELYRGKQLLAFGRVDETGLYVFEDVPLNFGNNDFEVVLYGPQGQIERRNETKRITGDMLKPGKTNIEASIMDANERIIRIDDRFDDRPQGTAISFRLTQGINRFLSAFATYTRLPTSQSEDDPDVDDVEQTYVTAGIYTPVLGGVSQVEAYKHIDGGTALDINHANKFAGIRVNLRAAKFNDFESEDVDYGEKAKTYEVEARADTNIRGIFNGLGLSLSALQTVREDDSKDTSLRASQSLSIAGLRATHATNTRLKDGHHSTTTGSLNVNKRLSSHWSVRSLLQYDIYPELELDETGIEFRYSNQDKITSTLDLRQGLQDNNDRTRVALNTTYDFGTFLGTLGVNWDDEDAFNVRLQANTSLAPYGKNGKYIASSENLLSRSYLRGRVFKDLDYDGVYGEGDELLEDAELGIDGRRTDKSNAQGLIEEPNAQPQGLAYITVMGDSLPDPFLAPLYDGYSTIIRPGTTPFIDMPVVLTGAIDGTVYFANGDPIPGVTVQLLDQAGQVVQENMSLFDGYYVFEYIKPGTYTVRLDPTQQVSIPPITVKVTSNELFAYGQDLKPLEQAMEVLATEKAVDGGSGRITHIRHPSVASEMRKPAPFASDGRFQATVRQVRVGEHPDKVRLVLDLSAPAGYRIISENDGEYINIDLPGTSWDAARNWALSSKSLFASYELYALPNNQGTRLRLKGRTPMAVFYNTALPPAHGKGNRIYIDFLKTRN